MSCLHLEFKYMIVFFRGRDMKRDMVDYYGMPDITIAMFLSSMNTIVDKLETKKRKVIFIVVSDNPIWVQKVYIPKMRRAFDVYQAGNP